MKTYPDFYSPNISMGSISANIADNQVKIDYAVSIMVLGSGIFMTGGQIPWCACVDHCEHRLSGFLSSMLCVVSCVLARLKLAKAS
jgi:hypothetical protein